MKRRVAIRTALIACLITSGLMTASVALPSLAAAQEQDVASVALGKALFEDRCAGCHGADATGNGPAASSLKVPPANLTEISQRAGGAFPAPRVVEIITFGGNIAAHGSGPMPVWGKVFSDEGGGGKVGATVSKQSVQALKRYLETIQK